MPTRTIGLETLRAKPGRNRKGKLADLTDINGCDLLALFHGFLNDLDPSLLINESTGFYTRIDDLIPLGRTVVVVTESGYFGEQGQTIHVRTGETAHTRTEDMSATTMTRLAFTVPPKGETGLFCVERSGRSTSGPKLIELFRQALLGTFNTFSWTHETVVETAAWIEASQLEEVRAVVYSMPTDIAKGVLAQGHVLGRVEHTLLPSKGDKMLPFSLWKALRDGHIKAGEFLGFEGRDVDETTVVASKDGRKKRFNIEREKTPAIRSILSEQGDPVPANIEFLRRSQDEARDYFTGMGLTWQETWRDGAWTQDALQVQLSAR